MLARVFFFLLELLSRIHYYLKNRAWTNSKAFLTTTCVFQVSVAARMWGRAQVLVLLIVVLTTATRGENAHHEDNQLKVGRSIDIFTRYGYLSLTMKVRWNHLFHDFWWEEIQCFFRNIYICLIFGNAFKKTTHFYERNIFNITFAF